MSIRPKHTFSPDLIAFRDEFEYEANEHGLHCDVLGEGPLNARVAIFGEGPGETEVRQNAPWVGGAGRLLWDSLRPHGIHRANTYVSNVVKRQISLSRKGNERHAVMADELHKWIGLAKWEAAQLRDVRVIFVLGNYALHTFTGQTGITEWRGSVLRTTLPNGHEGYIVCSINPAFAIKDRRMEPMFIHDCWKLSLAESGNYVPHEVDVEYNLPYQKALDAIRAFKHDGRPLSYDIEFGNYETICHGLSSDPHRAVCLNLRTSTSNLYTVQQEADIIYALQDLFDHKRKCNLHLIAQNGQFDSYWVWLKDLLRFQCTFDTLLAHHTLYPTLPHSLAYQVAQYTLHPFYKDEGKQWREGGDIDQHWVYNGKDAALTYAVAMAEKAELERTKLYDLFTKHVMRLQPHCVAATVHGVAVDLDAKTKAIAESQAEVSKLRDQFWRVVQDLTNREGYYPNPGSWQQMQVLFFDVLGMVGKGRSTGADNRQHIMSNPNTRMEHKELLSVYERLVTISKFSSTFAEVALDVDNRIRCEYRQFGVAKAPGRTSSKGLIYGVGMNMQNQPVAARKMYVADYHYEAEDKPKGRSKADQPINLSAPAVHRRVVADTQFFYFDGSQAEARVVAYRANIPEWKEQFERARLDGSYDCHRALAAEMFKVPYDEVPKKDIDDAGNPTIRYIAKRCRHGLNYRMGVERLAEVTELPYSKARTAYSLYHKLTPELRRWWSQAEEDFRKNKVAYNAFGRPLSVVQRVDDAVLESIVAFYPQSTIGDWKNRIWYMAQEDPKWPVGHARIALDVHDSLTGIAEPRYIKTALSICKRYAEDPIMIQSAWYDKAEPLIIPAECKVSTLDLFEKDKRTGKYVKVGEDTYHRWSNLVDIEL